MVMTRAWREGLLISCLQILKKHSIKELTHMASIALPGFNLGKELKP